MPDGLSLLPFYSFDTSAIINGRHDIFIPPTFDVVWDGIVQMVAVGQVRAVDEVKRELAKKSDDAAGWAKGCGGLFVPLSCSLKSTKPPSCCSARRRCPRTSSI
jgi:hypothetical protein